MHDFHYISKHDPKVQEAFQELQVLIHELQDAVRDDFTFSYRPVGSYSRNMITFDTKANVGFDFDINIEVNDEQEEFSAKDVKTALIKGLNSIAPKHGFDFPENSTRVITIKVKDRKHSKIIYSCDFAIVNNYEDADGNEYQQYIRFNKNNGGYSWCEQPDGYYMLPEKYQWIIANSDQGFLDELRELYIEKKNLNDDPNVHSRTIFANAVHEVCQKEGFYDE